MNWTTKILFIIFGFGIFLTSCEKKECEDPIPSLSYLDFQPSPTDSNELILTHEFADCDGDFGMVPGAKILDENGEIQLFNLLIDLYYLEDGIWKKHDWGSNASLNTSIPVLENSNLDPSLEGEIDKSLSTADFVILGYDTIMYKTRILDNAGHYSNEVESPGIVTGI